MDALVAQPATGRPDPQVRSAAVDSLAGFGGEARPWVLGALKSRDPEPRVQACNALSRIRMSVDVIPDLIAAMGDGDGRVRLAAVEGLRRVWQEVGGLCNDRTKTRAIRSLDAAIEDPSWEVRRETLLAMREVDARKAIPTTRVEMTTHDVDFRVRAAAVLALHAYRPHDPRSIAALEELIGDPGPGDADVDHRVGSKSWAIQALRESAGERAVLETLIPLVEGRDTRIRLDAIRLLPVPIPAVERLHAALRRALRDDDARVRGEAALMLLTVPGRKPDAECIAAVEAAAEIPVENAHQLNRLYRYVIELRMKAPGSEVRALPTLFAAIDRVGRSDQIDIVDFIATMGPGVRVAIPRLIELSSGPDARLAAAAELALGKIDPDVSTP